MSEEEMNKKMEFIVEQQANFAAQIEMMREVQAADAELLKEETKLLKEETKQLKEHQRTLSDAVLTIVGLIRNLTEVQQRMEERLTEAQRRTDERLNIFINVVERYISGNGGGKTNPA